MKFLIVGYGRVGSRTGRVLREEGHDVTIVDNDEKKVDRALDEGFDAVLGDGGTESVLKEAGVEAADAIGGLTGDPNINFAACMLGTEFGCRTVMRISEDYRQEIYERYADGVDEIVYPERLGAAGAKTALLGGDFNAIGDLTDQLSLTTVTIPDGAPVIGEHVANIDLGKDGRVYAHGRQHEPMTIPLPGTVVEPGDQLALIAERNALEQVRSKLLG
ncbi:TRK potassium uptake system protein [Haloferax mucosum ATCC BAA-1512]|uniref:TRK potassium uptake system protein n=1 Tax=Haloferax mucosum ATCC BAA-1512 TaxID=662479 RepID=M0IA19_9EURY|nr:TrkA family potassium uptake protein [Haloferax mucosum]ELZ92877.1 TRK potassium uptake system protein [Haloferax mucosum ATCC BAA-1512]